MSPVLQHLRRNLVAYIALFIALGGTGYAAVSLPRASVGARQIRNHVIDPVKFNPKRITGNVRAWAVVDSSGRIVRGGGKPQGGATVTPGSYAISWGVRISSTCATEATVDFGRSPATEDIAIPGQAAAPFTAGYAVAQDFSDGAGRRNNMTFVHTFNQDGQLTPLGFDLAVVC